MKYFPHTLTGTALLLVPLAGHAGGLTEAAAEPVIEPVVVEPAPGYDWTGFSGGVQLGYGDIETEGAADLEGDDVTYGLRAFYDYDFGRFVAGAGIQYDKTDIDLEGIASVDSVLRAGVRAGFDSGRNFFYATGGYADAQTDDGALDVGDSDGYYAGLGYEVFLTENLTAGAEVLYHEFDDFEVEDLEAEATTVNLSLNYRF